LQRHFRSIPTTGGSASCDSDDEAEVLKKRARCHVLSEAELADVQRTLAEHNYEVRRTIAAGATATILKVWSTMNNHEFAVKVAHIESNHAWAVESQLLKTLSHPNVVRIYATFDDSVFGYLVLEHCPGGDLNQRLKTTGHLQVPEFVDIALQLCNAVEYCHSCRIAHLDLKPANVLFAASGRIRLADFGCCRFADDPSFFGGSEPFMSPEIIAGIPNFDKFQSDIWSLGVVFYVMAAGTLPWGRRKGDELRAAIRVAVYDNQIREQRIASIVATMLRLEPERRAALKDIQKLLSEIPTPSPAKTSSLSMFPARVLPSVLPSASARRLRLLPIDSDSTHQRPARPTLTLKQSRVWMSPLG
jgi:serine/threonine protein kinase